MSDFERNTPEIDGKNDNGLGCEACEACDSFDNHDNHDNSASEGDFTLTGFRDGGETLPKIKIFYEYLEVFCAALTLMILLLMFVFRYVSVDGRSMQNTLQDKDKLIISNLFYTPKTGDIVVITVKSESKPLIKRIIATEGQHVKIDYDKWEVYVDGVLLDEPYILRENGRMLNGPEEFIVSKGKVFVMGDHRNDSKDSRSLGELNAEDILGRVIIRLYPFSEFGKVN